jgi:hypothetical protein
MILLQYYLNLFNIVEIVLMKIFATIIIIFQAVIKSQLAAYQYHF